MSTFNEYEQAGQKLKDEYSRHFSNGNIPNWAAKKQSNKSEAIHCAIPLVGKNYYNQPYRFLLYASAENIDENSNYSILDNDTLAINRHRKLFEDTKNDDYRFYPSVHIQPISDGALLLAALYIVSKIAPEMVTDSLMPADFIEMISLGNYGKFTIERKSKKCDDTGKIISSANKDYASKRELLNASENYIKTDLDILKPTHIIMPTTIYNTVNRDFLSKYIKDDIKFIGIYQINARNINGCIKSKGSARQESELTTLIRNWYNNISSGGFRGKTFENLLYMFSYLDAALDKIE